MNYIDMIKKNDNTHIIKLEKKLYSKSSILKSCYKFTDETYIFIETSKENNIDFFLIYFTAKKAHLNAMLSQEFMNELLDQELRTIIYNETHKIRDTIVTRALLSGQPNDN